jgi:hypothetical protein
MKAKSFKALLTFLVVATSFSPAAFADTGDIGLGLNGGTLGLGGQVTVGLTSSINARAGINGFRYEGKATKSDISYDYKLNLLSFPVLADWHPMEGSGFRLTSGILFNNNNVKATGRPSATYKIGDVLYSAADIGALTGKVDFNAVAPYVGLGWGNAVSKHSRLSLALDLGVAFQGTPSVSLEASGPVASTTAFQTELNKEVADIKDKTKNLKYYPVLSIGLAYKF